jgi:hypothetical protein
MPPDHSDRTPWLTVRLASEGSILEIASMVEPFVRDHPAATRDRPMWKPRTAYFGEEPVAQLMVAVRGGRLVGLAQWVRIYDVFSAMYGGEVGRSTFGPQPEVSGSC